MISNQLNRGSIELWRNPRFGEESTCANVLTPPIVCFHDGCGEGFGHRKTASQDAAHRGVGVTQICAAIHVNTIGPQPGSAWVRMLDKNTSLASRSADRQLAAQLECSVGINVIVE